MKFTVKPVYSIILFILLIGSSLFADTNINSEAIAQTAALKMGEDGFIIKGSYESGLLKKGESKYITLTLYQTNTYKLSVGTGSGLTDYKVYLYDENYNLIQEKQIANNDFVFLDVVPKETQSYYIKIDYNKGLKAKAEWVFLYGYKN